MNAGKAILWDDDLLHELLTTHFLLNGLKGTIRDSTLAPRRDLDFQDVSP
jgi:hypothetical protein